MGSLYECVTCGIITTDNGIGDHKKDSKACKGFKPVGKKSRKRKAEAHEETPSKKKLTSAQQQELVLTKISELSENMKEIVNRLKNVPSYAGSGGGYGPGPSSSNVAQRGDRRRESPDRNSNSPQSEDSWERVKPIGATQVYHGRIWQSKKVSYTTRCLACCILMAQEGRSVLQKGLSKKISKLIETVGINPGIDITPRSRELVRFDNALNIRMIIYSSKRSVLYDSCIANQPPVLLLWFQRAWYFIDDIARFLSIFECPACPLVTDKHSNLIRHFSRCSLYKQFIETGVFTKSLEVREEKVYSGIWRGLKSTKLVDQINAVTNLDITIKDIFSPYIAVIDCESALLENNNTNEFLAETRCTVYASTHKMYCFGVGSNVPNNSTAKVFLRSSEGNKQFLHDFVQHLLGIAEVAYQRNKIKVRPILSRLDKLLDWYRAVNSTFLVLKLEKVKKDLLTYIRQLLVCGYNIFRYDITLAKREGLLDLLHKLDPPVIVMKRTKGTYLSIKSYMLAFVDQINYTGKVSLRSLLVQYGKGQKSYFPYDKIKQLSDLKLGLPKYEDFFDRLCGCNSLNFDHLSYQTKLEEGLSEAQALKAVGFSQPPKTGRELYTELYATWEAKGFKTMEDIMKSYLIDDIDPLKDLIVNYRELYLNETGVDLYRQYLSMSQFSFNYAHTYVDSTKYFFVHMPLDVRLKLLESLIGGLSIVFHRLAERGMQIRPAERNDGEKVNKILGVDESIEWLQYCAQVHFKGLIIRTQWSEEGEQTLYIPLNDGTGGFKRFKPDGYAVSSGGLKIAFEYLGEYAHGYCPDHKTDENDDEAMVGGQTSKELREFTFKRLDMIKQVVDKVVVMWSCQWAEMKRSDPLVQSFMSTFRFGPAIKKRSLTQEEALDQILNKDIRGFVQVDATTPLELRNPDGLADFPPIIKNVMISRDNIMGYGKVYAEKYNLLEKPTRSLVSSYFCDKTYISTDYLIFLDSLGVRVTYIHEILQFQMHDMFKSFIVDRATRRAQADLDGDPHTAKLQKDAVNHCYGSSLLNASGLINTKLVDESKVMQMLGNLTFIDAEPCGFDSGSDLWELITRKTEIRHKNLITLGFNVLQYSKVHILDYYYNHLKKFIPSKCFQLINGDTDSFYLSHSRGSLRECVPNRKLPAYDASCAKWLVDENDPWSKRTPGKYHMEWEGTKMCALTNKMYTGVNEDTGAEKKAHRGIKAKHIDNWKVIHYDCFVDTLFERNTQNPTVTMTGFVDKASELLTYESRRSNMNALYTRRLMPELIQAVEPIHVFSPIVVVVIAP